jgi:hypothetical protein
MYNEGFSDGFGAVRVAIISEDWKNDNNEQHAIYWHQFVPGATGNVITVESVKFDTVGDNDCATSVDLPTKYGKNEGLASSVKNLEAGAYSIVLIHRVPE